MKKVDNEHIICSNCNWEWNTINSEENDKYICHKCGNDNSILKKIDISNLYTAKSKIHGKGLFTKTLIPIGTKIMLVADIKRKDKGLKWITTLGGYLNHSVKDNVILVQEGNLYFVYALKSIKPNEELTVDYSTLKDPFSNITNFDFLNSLGEMFNK